MQNCGRAMEERVMLIGSDLDSCMYKRQALLEFMVT